MRCSFLNRILTTHNNTHPCTYAFNPKPQLLRAVHGEFEAERRTDRLRWSKVKMRRRAPLQGFKYLISTFTIERWCPDGDAIQIAQFGMSYWLIQVHLRCHGERLGSWRLAVAGVNEESTFLFILRSNISLLCKLHCVLISCEFAPSAKVSAEDRTWWEAVGQGVE